MIEIEVRRDYRGPSIFDMEALLPITPVDTVTEIAWTNTKAELQTIRRYPDHRFHLFVPDIGTGERTATSLNAGFHIPKDIIVQGMNAVINKGVWRTYLGKVGASTARASLLIGAAANIRKGKDPKNMRKILSECVLQGTSVVDADVLLCLRALGAKAS